MLAIYLLAVSNNSCLISFITVAHDNINMEVTWPVLHVEAHTHIYGMLYGLVFTEVLIHLALKFTTITS